MKMIQQILGQESHKSTSILMLLSYLEVQLDSAVDSKFTTIITESRLITWLLDNQEMPYQRHMFSLRMMESKQSNMEQILPMMPLLKHLP